jgi:hypothetical protein
LLDGSSYLGHLFKIQELPEVIERRIDVSSVAGPNVRRRDNHRNFVYVRRVKAEVDLTKKRRVVALVFVLRKSTPSFGRIHRPNRSVLVALQLGFRKLDPHRQRTNGCSKSDEQRDAEE